jgi:hypothetical protein
MSHAKEDTTFPQNLSCPSTRWDMERELFDRKGRELQQEGTRRTIVGVVSISGMLLSGCTPSYSPERVGLWLARPLVGGPVERTLLCACPPDAALRYAINAAQGIGMKPYSVTPAGFEAYGREDLGLAQKFLNISVRPVDPAATEVRVRAEESGGSRYNEKLAGEFAAAFENRRKGDEAGTRP